MYKSVLVAMALDHDLSHKLLAFARSIAAPDAKITALHVIEEITGTGNAGVREDLRQSGAASAQALLKQKLESFPEVEGRIMEGHVSRTLVDVATERGIDCLVMGSHKPGLVDYLIGSTAARVVRHAPCSVHVYRDTEST